MFDYIVVENDRPLGWCVCVCVCICMWWEHAHVERVHMSVDRPNGMRSVNTFMVITAVPFVWSIGQFDFVLLSHLLNASLLICYRRIDKRTTTPRWSLSQYWLFIFDGKNMAYGVSHKTCCLVIGEVECFSMPLTTVRVAHSCNRIRYRIDPQSTIGSIHQLQPLPATHH